MKRRLFNILATVSLVTCLASTWLWVRGYRYDDGIMVEIGSRQRIAGDRANVSKSIGIGHVRGGYTFSFSRRLLRRDGEPWIEYGASPVDRSVDDGMRAYFLDPIIRMHFAGFWIGNPPHNFVRIPDYAVVLVTTLATVWWLRRRLELKNRRRQGLCLHCGYDLRASKGKCPECGTAVPVKEEGAAT
jgi:hypothetical protein